MTPLYKAIDLFAGAGGFGLGFQLSGFFDVLCSLEIDHWAAETLRKNKGDTSIIIEGDIREFATKKQILEACKGNIPDVIIGGPPCQGFSIAGPPKDPKDPRNSLFIDFARWVECLQPNIFVMENVKGLLSRYNAEKEKVIDVIKKKFENLGYTVDIWQLNAALYGVPQFRERIFIVGNRFGKHIEAPAATHFIEKNGKIAPLFGSTISAIKVWEALSDLPSIEAGEGEEEQDYTISPSGDYQIWARGAQERVFNHVAMKHSRRTIERFKLISSNGKTAEIPKDLRVRKRNGNGELSESTYHSNNRRLDPKAPSFTIPAHFYSSFIHPFKNRNITAREAARLQSFPDSYIFMGKRTMISHKLLAGRNEVSYLSQYNQIGNAVPPLLARAIANKIFQILEENLQ